MFGRKLDFSLWVSLGERAVARSRMFGNLLVLKCMTRFDANARRWRVTVKSGAVVILLLFSFFFCCAPRFPLHQASCGPPYLTWTGRRRTNIWWSSRPKTWADIWVGWRGPRPSPWSWAMSTTTRPTSDAVSAPRLAGSPRQPQWLPIVDVASACWSRDDKVSCDDREFGYFSSCLGSGWELSVSYRVVVLETRSHIAWAAEEVRSQKYQCSFVRLWP